MRAVDKHNALNYLAKADSSLRMAKIAAGEKAYDNAVMSAIHASINALDALTTSYLGKRASGSHTDVLTLIKPIFANNEYGEIAKQFSSLLSLKNASEYQPDLMSSDDAERSLTWANRIVERVRQKLKSS